MSGKRMTQYEALMEWRSLARQEKERAEVAEHQYEVERDRADDLLLDRDYAEGMLETVAADLDRAEAENRYWRESHWWYRLLWWKKR